MLRVLSVNLGSTRAGQLPGNAHPNPEIRKSSNAASFCLSLSGVLKSLEALVAE